MIIPLIDWVPKYKSDPVAGHYVGASKLNGPSPMIHGSLDFKLIAPEPIIAAINISLRL